MLRKKKQDEILWENDRPRAKTVYVKLLVQLLLK